jgi:hypothetical protein
MGLLKWPLGVAQSHFLVVPVASSGRCNTSPKKVKWVIRLTLAGVAANKVVARSGHAM